MPKKPTTAAGYPPGQVARVKSTCLYFATKFGDLMEELVVVGGLVPSLLVDQEHLPDNVGPHVGTLDLDVGLTFALVGDQRYQTVVERLQNAGFEPDKNEDGNVTRQRWRRSPALLSSPMGGPPGDSPKSWSILSYLNAGSPFPLLKITKTNSHKPPHALVFKLWGTPGAPMAESRRLQAFKAPREPRAWHRTE